MSDAQPKNPLHGITLEALLTELVARRGWDDLAEHIDIRCFRENPSINSSLKFLRKTPWARTRLERLYLTDKRRRDRRGDPAPPTGS